jgi:hypothetical protein
MSPGNVEVVSFVEDFLRSSAAGSDPLESSDPSTSLDVAAAACEVERASREMERAWTPTHNAVALRSAATGGSNESRTRGQ